MRMGNERHNQIKFNSAEKSFLEFFDANLTETEMSNFRVSLLMNNEQRMERARELMERHQLYKVEPSKASLRVKKAWGILDDFLESKAEYIRENGLTPVIYGSVTFDDPRSFDFDLCFVGMKDRQDVVDTVSGWVDKLSDSWYELRPEGTPNLRGMNGHIDYISLEKLEMYANAFKENRREFVDKADFDMFVYFMEATSVLIGNYPYSTEEEEGRYKERFLEILQESPLLFTYTLWGLEQSLIERETRRAGVGDHQTGEDSH
jgi:hypothetical protein